MIQNYDLEILKRLNKNDFLDIIYNEFQEEHYEEVIEIKNYLVFFKPEYVKDINIIYLVILSLVALDKIKQAKVFLDEVKIKEDYPDYFSDDEAKYILLLNDEEVDKKQMIFLMFFDSTDIDNKKDFIIAIVSFTSCLVEFGYETSLVTSLNNDLMIIL